MLRSPEYAAYKHTEARLWGTGRAKTKQIGRESESAPARSVLNKRQQVNGREPAQLSIFMGHLEYDPCEVLRSTVQDVL